MPYYPKSQIQTNLYTSGGEYSLISSKSITLQTPYVGYYYKLSNGQIYTGKTPTDNPSQILYPIASVADEPTTLNQITIQYDTALPDSNISVDQYNSILKNNIPKRRSLPLPNTAIPTDQEFLLGVYTRYFCKKNNELKYMEIDKTTFDKLKTKTKDIAWDLYTPISTLWYIRSSDVNKSLITQIEQKQGWYGFTQWFKDKF